MASEPAVYCSECGRRKNKRWITMSGQMLAGLEFIAWYGKQHGGKPMALGELGRAFGGTHSAVYQAFHNLRYFGLVAWADGKANGWIITKWGEWFLEDEHDVPRRVRVFDNLVIETDPSEVSVKDVPRIKVDYDYALTQMSPVTDEETAANVARRRSEGDDDA